MNNLMTFFQNPNTADPFSQQQQQQPAPKPAAPQAPAMPNNPTDPGFNKAPAGPGGTLQQGQSGNGELAKPAQNSLDSFNPLFQNDPKNVVEDVLALLHKPVIEPDFQKLTTDVRATSMVGQLDPEVARKALSGDMQAFTQILDQVAQNAFLQSAQFAHNLTETGIKTFNGRLDKALPRRLQEMQARQAVQAANPTLLHEAARPVVEALTQHFSAQLPNATPQEIATRVTSYLSALQPAAAAPQGPAIDPLTGRPLNQQQQQEHNWGNFFAGN